MNDSIMYHKEGETILHVFEDSYGKIKTSVCRPDKLESNVLYHGYDTDTALEVANECLERFDIDEVESLAEIEWNS